MGRPLEFSHEDVVGNAVNAFWREGFESLSANDLAEAMGVAKSSLYNTFASKHGVLLHAITHYSDVRSAEVRALAAKGNVVGTLRDLLCEIARNNDDGRGCLLVNTAAELGSRNEEVRTLVKAGFVGMQKAFAVIIEAGIQSGAIKPTVDAAAFALSLITGIAGIRVLAKSGFTKDELLPFIELLLQELRM